MSDLLVKHQHAAHGVAVVEDVRSKVSVRGSSEAGDETQQRPVRSVEAEDSVFSVHGVAFVNGS